MSIDNYIVLLIVILWLRVEWLFTYRTKINIDKKDEEKERGCWNCKWEDFDDSYNCKKCDEELTMWQPIKKNEK